MTHIEVDQSGKVEQFNMDTVIAFSNSNQYSVMLPKAMKQEVHLNYKGKVKSLKYKLFCIGVYHCIRECIIHKELITICFEYWGKEDLIKSILLDLSNRDGLKIDKNIFRFASIGKSSNAHVVAIDVFRGNQKPNLTLSEEDIARML